MGAVGAGGPGAVEAKGERFPAGLEIVRGLGAKKDLRVDCEEEEEAADEVEEGLAIDEVVRDEVRARGRGAIDRDAGADFEALPNSSTETRLSISLSPEPRARLASSSTSPSSPVYTELDAPIPEPAEEDLVNPGNPPSPSQARLV